MQAGIYQDLIREGAQRSIDNTSFDASAAVTPMRMQGVQGEMQVSGVTFFIGMFKGIFCK
jgi:hypothetical protein